MKIICSALLIFACTAVFAQNSLIKNVNIVDVENGRILPGKSVLILDGKIAKVAANGTMNPPAGTNIIDGMNQYLMPGMADAHMHFFQSGSLYTRPDAVDLRKVNPYEEELKFARNNAVDYLKRYLRLGITTVVDVGGPMMNFAVRDSIASGITGPNILVTGPLFSMVDRSQLGTDKPIVKITNTATADSLLQTMLSYKPDFIKIWYVVTPEMPAEKNYELVKYIAEQTHKSGLKLAVHATELNTAMLAVKAGADILVHSVDDAVMPDDFLSELKKKNITYIPTLIVSENYYKSFSGQLQHHSQDLYWANPAAYGTLTDPEAMENKDLPAVLQYLRKNGIPPSVGKDDSIMSVNLKRVVAAGVNVATGTDAGNIGTQHGSSYLQEQEAMLRFGMTIPQVLKSSTINVAKAFGKSDQWGSIEVGKKADLILLSKNPLADIQNLMAIQSVIKNGQLFIPDSIVKESPEFIVQRQLNAYNAKNIEAFLDTYAEDVELYEFPAKLIARGKKDMRKSYESMFSNIKNLYCKIEERIVIGNKIIDKEKVRVGDNTISAVAIYEVIDGKIKKVTFIQ